jgi:peptide/nickel transport system substrate-binding protein
MHRFGSLGRGFALVAVMGLVAAACSGRSATPTPTASGSSTVQLATTTTAATNPTGKIVWAVYRDVNSLDPVVAFDYPENTADSLMCESLLRQAPNGALDPGLASVANPSPTSIVFTLQPGVKFWDGNPVTPADVVYSLDRAYADPNVVSYYGATFSRVKSIDATGSNTVTITLKQPDYWLEGELASMPGIIIEKKFAEAQGKNYGTPAGSIMCTGLYKFQSFKPGVGVVAVANDNYWNPAVKPLVKEIDIKGEPNTASFTSSMLTGSTNGSFTFALSTLNQLKQSDKVTVTPGVGWSTDALVIDNLKGPLGNVKVRQALSLALDRQGIIDAVYQGAATLPRMISNPGTFGYAASVFQKANDALPEMTQNIAQAKQLVQEAGATGKTITIGMSPGLTNNATEAGAYQAAAAAIGMKVVFKPVSPENYINFFIDPKARAGTDGFMTVNYGDYADPAAMIATFVLPTGSQNYDGYNNPAVTKLMDQARGTADPNARAQLVSQAETLLAKDLPWIPNVEPENVLVTSSNLTGAVASFAYMFAPWADQLGGKS